MGKGENGDFSETIAASDLKVGRCRQLIEFMNACEHRMSRLSLYHIFSRSCEPNNQLNVCTTSVTEGEVARVKLV